MFLMPFGEYTSVSGAPVAYVDFTVTEQTVKF